MEFPSDKNTFGIDTNFLLGDSLYVASVFNELDKAVAYLPPSTDWYNFFTGEVQEPSSSFREYYLALEEMVVFVKAGSIIPRKHIKRLSALKALNDNYSLEIYPTLREEGHKATGFLFLDDGETYNYKNKS